jgi:hypothetical protein
MLLLLPSCGHAFHHDCILTWLGHNKVRARLAHHSRGGWWRARPHAAHELNAQRACRHNVCVVLPRLQTCPICHTEVGLTCNAQPRQAQAEAAPAGKQPQAEQQGLL